MKIQIQSLPEIHPVSRTFKRHTLYLEPFRDTPCIQILLENGDTPCIQNLLETPCIQNLLDTLYLEPTRDTPCIQNLFETHHVSRTFQRHTLYLESSRATLCVQRFTLYLESSRYTYCIQNLLFKVCRYTLYLFLAWT